jgi:hypothetical protein
VVEKGSEGSLVSARPLGLTQPLCEKLLKPVRVVDGAPVLAANPAWAGAIDTVLVKKGVKVSELRRAGRSLGSLRSGHSHNRHRQVSRIARATPGIAAPTSAMRRHIMGVYEGHDSHSTTSCFSSIDPRGCTRPRTAPSLRLRKGFG